MRGASRPLSRPLIFAGVVAVHAGLLLLIQRGLILFPVQVDEPLQLLFLTPPRPAPRLSPPTAAPRLQAHPTAPAARKAAPESPAAATAAPPEDGRSPLSIDWSAETALVAQHQTELAAAPKPRSLDDHHRHGNHQDGWGLNSRSAYKFGWYYAGTHRLDTSSGLPIININDRCSLTFGFLIPLPLCRIGKIPVKGDLFKHMHDPPPDSGETPP